NVSVIVKSVDASAHAKSVNVRTPLNIGSIPSLHTIDFRGSNAVTVGRNVRAGAVGALRASLLPSAIVPAAVGTVEFQFGIPFASVRSAQIASAPARMLAVTAQVIRNVVAAFRAVISVVIVGLGPTTTENGKRMRPPSFSFVTASFRPARTF